MSKLKLPRDMRPRNVKYRQCELGVDLPASFVHDLRGLDDCLYPVYHPYKILWDDVINEYTGELENPRYQINSLSGELVFGFILTNGQGVPSPDGHWHIWRLCRDRGWAHVINIDSKDPGYLDLLVRRLWLQDQYNQKYGFRGYQRMLEEMDLAARDKAMDEKKDLMNEIAKANSGMMARVRENFERGIVKPHNPQKEIIVSGKGINKRSKIVRPLDDAEGGLILPEDF
jgi:hypothetical protein